MFLPFFFSFFSQRFGYHVFWKQRDVLFVYGPIAFLSRFVSTLLLICPLAVFLTVFLRSVKQKVPHQDKC